MTVIYLIYKNPALIICLNIKKAPQMGGLIVIEQKVETSSSFLNSGAEQELH